MNKHIVDQADLSFSIQGNVYQIQRRANHNQIVINNSYESIKIMNPWTVSEVLNIPSPNNYSSSGVIDAWCFRSDGNAIGIFNQNETLGIIYGNRNLSVRKNLAYSY